MNAKNDTRPQLVGIEKCLETVFPDERSRPALRTFAKWKADGFIPFFKIGRRVFFDPEQVRAAIEKQFRHLATK
jgi:hypothetical protein